MLFADISPGLVLSPAGEDDHIYWPVTICGHLVEAP
ncbi:MAG: hypothetical protein JWL97_4225 [Gemmatimonadales bacterium]|nr:hypothetical protein [Gemmatimonadales bacterium]